MILTGNKEYFKGINAISYEVKDSDNPLAFKYYDPKKGSWRQNDGRAF